MCVWRVLPLSTTKAMMEGSVDVGGSAIIGVDEVVARRESAGEARW